MTRYIKITLIIIVGALTTMCTPKVPDSAVALHQSPKITPDYTDLDIPANIAPLNFNIDEKGDAYVTRFRSSGGELVAGGRTLDIDVDAWHDLLRKSQGDTIYADVYVRQNGRWRQYAPIRYFVAEDIDPYISYRHIEPLYVNFEVLRICQRNLENFDIDEIYNNSTFNTAEGDRQCINCHSYQDYNRSGNMQMHVRVVNPGTLIVRDGKITKINLKVGDAFGPGAYCSWHPTLPIIAYSINDTWQHFHSASTNKVEVQDAASGLIMYNVDTNTMSFITDSPTELETFPYWSPDGDYLYYVSAKVPEMTPQEMANYRMTNYKDFKYNIYRKRFDKSTLTFAETDTIFDAAAKGMSATFPRQSPDGRYMIFTLGEYGTFHNFHHDADLYIMDLATGETKPLDELNSDDTESYHSFSSSGRWIIFSSRRGGGSYTRLYLAHFDENGRASKPFILPQRSPFSNDLMFQSYNVPEFMVKPVDISRQDWIEAVKKPAVNAIAD